MTFARMVFHLPQQESLVHPSHRVRETLVFCARYPELNMLEQSPEDMGTADQQLKTNR
jgi:hypothetical protein